MKTTGTFDTQKKSLSLPSIRDMLAQLIAAQSVSSPDEKRDQSNLQAIELLAQWCDDLGLETHIQEVALGKYNLIAQLLPTSSSNNTASNNTASNEKGLMFAGHTDTVDFIESQWDTDPFTLREIDNHWVGLGVCDMKGFFPLALHAIASCIAEQKLKDPKYWQKNLRGPITLLATCDEETTMAGARALSRESTAGAHHVIIGEPSECRPIYTHKGILTTKLILSGIRGHASNPDLGANAIEAANWVITQLLQWRQELKIHENTAFQLPHPTISLGCIHGGTNSNVICDQCEILLDIRLLPNMPVHQVEQELMQRLTGLDQAVPKTSLALERIEYLQPFTENPETRFFDFMAKATGCQLTSSDFVTEAPLLQQLGHTPVVCGPGSITWAHKPNEQLPLENIQPMLKTLSYCINDLFTQQQPAQ